MSNHGPPPGWEPTMYGDEVAQIVRAWYEDHRENWWRRRKKYWQLSADDFILGLINEVHRAERQLHALAQRSYDD